MASRTRLSAVRARRCSSSSGTANPCFSRIARKWGNSAWRSSRISTMAGTSTARQGDDALCRQKFGSGIPAFCGRLRTAMADRTSAMTIDGRPALSPRSNACGHRSLYRVHRVVDGVHRPAGPLNHPGRHCPLDGAPGMNRAAYATRNQQPGDETHPDPLRHEPARRTLRLSEEAPEQNGYQAPLRRREPHRRRDQAGG